MLCFKNNYLVYYDSFQKEHKSFLQKNLCIQAHTHTHLLYFLILYKLFSKKQIKNIIIFIKNKYSISHKLP